MRYVLKGIVGLAATVAVASPAVWIAVNAGAGTGTPRNVAADAVAAGSAPCPTPFPVDQVTDGMTGWGLTVSKGTAPDKFTVQVQGVLKDGIAPGIDMILAEAESPALAKAGSIWAGMSGSPVYAEDGRLLGAVGYGFSGASKLAGITPAASMLDILKKPDQAGTSAVRRTAKVKLTASLRKKVTGRGLVSARAAGEGLSPLPMPYAVSGLSGQRINAVNADLAKRGSQIRVRQAASANGAPAGADETVAGGNFGVLLSYGTVTQGAIGTTTVVCDGRALAFGHPFFRGAAGRVRLTAVSGSAISIVQDPVFGPFKLANFGGVIGTLTQDRPAGVSARLGAGPAVTPITAQSTSDGETRTDTSYVNRGEDVPLISAYHLWAGLDRARDAISGGGATTAWRIRGTSAGKPFDLTLSNKFADARDVTEAAGLDIAGRLAALENNPYSAVTFTDLKATASANETYRAYTAGKVLVKSGKRWVALDPEQPIKATAGKKLTVRVQLIQNRAPAKSVDLTLAVPKNAKGKTGSLSVLGGLSNPGILCDPDDSFTCADELRDQTKSFADLLAKLRATQRNDVLVGDLALGRGSAGHVKVQRKLDQVVDGRIEIGIIIR